MYRCYLKTIRVVICIWNECSVIKQKQQIFKFLAMKTHLTLSPALAGIGKATLYSVALEPPCLMKHFFFNLWGPGKNFQDYYKNWPAITQLHFACLRWSKRISHWTELKLQLQNRLQNRIISHERVRSNKKKRVWSRII